MHQLPTRIAALMIGSILVFVVTVVVSNSWLSRALDSHVYEKSVGQVSMARDNILSQVRSNTLDYTKWEAAVKALNASNLEWVYENIGGTANIGQLVQLVVLWGGTLTEDVGWTDDGIREGRPDLLEPDVLQDAERLLANVPMGTYEGAEFFAWRNGSLFAVGIARFEVVDGKERPAAQDTDIVRLAMGRRVTEDMLTSIAEGASVTGLLVAREVPSARPSIPLLGSDGNPVGYIAWDTPLLGTSMLRLMAPVLAIVVMLTAGLAAVAMALVRHNAQQLVKAERQASAAVTQALKAARSDDMTGLPNRAAFKEVIAAPARAGERGVIFLDVNDFKRVNDSLGHAVGDQVIVSVAGRLSKFATDDCFLARLSGDEFVFVVTGPDARARTRRLAQAVEQAMLEPLSVLGHQLRLSLAIGFAKQASNDMSGYDLLRQADLAMYEAKRHKGGSPVAFSALLGEASNEAQLLEQGLRAALSKSGELSVAYQPIVGSDGRLERAEALARWTSLELGVVTPDRFIPIAERSGLIVELGRQLLHRVCEDLVAHPDLKVSVNISPRQLMAPDFVPTLIKEMKHCRVDPQRIEIELTESVIVDDPRLAAERLAELRAAGFSTALDDFGTGYASMGALGQMGFDTLKIDRSFVTKLSNSEDDIMVMDGMITMAHGLKLRVVCEGTETAEEIKLLRKLGCDLVQGYHLDRPLPIEVLATRWLDRAEKHADVA